MLFVVSSFVKTSVEFMDPAGILRKDPADRLRTSIIPGRDLNTSLFAGSMYHLSVADIHGNMVDRSLTVVIKDQITGLHLAGLDRGTGLGLVSGYSRQGDSGYILINILYKAGTICAGIRIGTAPDIAVSDELESVIDQFGTNRILLIGLLLQR